MAAISRSTNSKNYSCIPEPVVIYRGSSLVCTETECSVSTDSVALDLYNSVKQVQLFFSQVFGICGIDGKGKTVPFELGWDNPNARWICKTDRCKWQFNDDLAIIPEVAAHEISHAVVRYSRSTPLVLANESGALNESIANVLAVAFRHWSGKSGWNVGDRYNLQAHVHVSQYNAAADIHYNSPIPSHAFFIAVTQAKSVSYGPIARIWLSAMSQVSSSATFVEFANKTIELSPQANGIQRAVFRGWLDVGVKNIPIPKPVKEKTFLEKVANFFS